MSEVTIVCPTHGRAGDVTALAVFGPELLLCVAESQEPAYRAAYAEARLDVHPDSVVGLGPKMTWMHEKYGAMFRVDDDVSRIVDHVGQGKVDPGTACAAVHRLADQAEQMGVFLFGLSADTVPMHFAPQRPFRLTGHVDGCGQGVLPGSELWWPEAPVGDDFWISALNAHRHRLCLVDERYALQAKVGQEGGLGSLRTEREVRRTAQMFVDAFGDAVTVNDDAKFTYPWRLKVPW